MPTMDQASKMIAQILQQLPVSERYAVLASLNDVAQAGAVQNESTEFARRRDEWRRRNRAHE